jgi:hypothetical protein
VGQVSQPPYSPYPTPPGDPASGAQRPPGSPELRRETEAAIAARRELGPEYEDAVAAGLADRVEQLVAYRTAELRAQAGQQTLESEAEKSRRTQRFALGIVSLGAGIPITAIAATNVEPGLIGVLISWAGIVGVNVAAALGDRRRR